MRRGARRRGSVKPKTLTVHRGGRRRRARAGLARLRETIKLLEDAGAGWWPEEPGWPTEPLRARDVRAIVASLLKEADRRWHAEMWSSHAEARVVDCFYDVVTRLPTPRRILEGLAAVGLVRLAQLHGVVPEDDR